jgi:hypothetical protein
MPRLNPDIPLELGGRTRTLKLNLNAYAGFEEMTGFELSALADALKEGAPKLRMMRTVLWALLITDEKDLTPEAVGEMVTFQNMQEVMAAVARMFTGPKDAAPAEAFESIPLPAAPPTDGPASGLSAG